MQDQNEKDFFSIIANKSLLTFIFVNILDLVFWLWGFMTLEYENGDKIRDELMRGAGEFEIEEVIEPYQIREDNRRSTFGTIKH